MASFVGVNSNNYCDSRVFDQLIFLKKLRQNDIDYKMASSFVNSREFNSIVKEFKRKRQQEDDQKKWENFLVKRKQEEINKTISGTTATFPANGYQQLDNNNFRTEGFDSASNTYCESGTDYTSHWLEDNHVFLGLNFHHFEGKNEKSFISLEPNKSTFFTKKGCQGECLKFAEYKDNIKKYSCNNAQYTARGMQYQHTHFQKEDYVGDYYNVGKQNSDVVNNIFNVPQHKPSQTDMLNMNYSVGQSILLHERNPGELQLDGTTAKLRAESEDTVVSKKTANSSPLTESVEISSSQKTLSERTKQERSSNAKNCYINEPEENYCKNIAKRIQEIPGVDTELRKVEDIRIKMTPILSNIRKMIAKNFNSPPSADEDLERIKQRTLEFGARFKRNYLYRTNCQVNKLKEMMPNPILISKKSKIILMIQKLATVHHAAIQALQVVEKQLQTISIFGKTQELLCSFYNCVYELSLILKPFYGYLKTQILDEVEKHLIETIKLLSDLKSEEKFSMPNKITKVKKSQLKSSSQPPPWMKKSAALARLKFGPPIRIRKRKSQEQKRKVLESKQSKDSMNSEQVDNIFLEAQRLKMLPQIDTTLCSSQTVFSKDNKLEEILKSSEVETNEPKNVKLIFIRSEDDDKKENMEIGNSPSEGGRLSAGDESKVLYDDLMTYKHDFKKFKKNIPLYEKNTLNTVIGMSETFLEETITEISKEINKMKISDLIGLVDEIETCEPDLESLI